MKAAHHVLVVTPTGDTSEYQKGEIIVSLTLDSSATKVYRGVLVDVGPHVQMDGLEPGCVVFYSGFWQVLDYHVVPSQNFLSFEPVS